MHTQLQPHPLLVLQFFCFRIENWVYREDQRNHCDFEGRGSVCRTCGVKWSIYFLAHLVSIFCVLGFLSTNVRLNFLGCSAETLPLPPKTSERRHKFPSLSFFNSKSFQHFKPHSCPQCLKRSRSLLGAILPLVVPAGLPAGCSSILWTF